MLYSFTKPRPNAHLERPIGVVVDADPEERRTLMRALAKLDLAAIGFSSAEASLAWLDMNRTPALLSIDFSLPAMSGLRLIEVVRADARLRPVPILATSARPGIDDERNALELGADGFLPKPLHLDAFLIEAGRLLRGRDPVVVLHAIG